MPATDPHRALVSSLLHFDGEHLSTEFDDEKGVVWTPSGSAAISTTQSRFGGAAARFDGTSACFLDRAAGAGVQFGDGDFTVEAFARFDNVAGNHFVFGHHSNFGLYRNNTQLLYFNGSNNIFNVGGVIAHSTWYHLALTRAAGTLRLFLNGALLGSAANSTDFNSTNFRLGALPSGVGLLTGYIDEVRITKGLARYIDTFTPPSEPFGLAVYVVSGFVSAGAPPEPQERTILLIQADTHEVVAGTQSDPVDGSYAFELGSALDVYGIAYVDYGLRWRSGEVYGLEDRTWMRVIETGDGHWFEAEQAGTSGETEPEWPLDGSTVEDGTVIWRHKGTMERPWIEGPYVPVLEEEA